MARAKIGGGAFMIDVDESITEFFNGPYWDDVAYQHFVTAEVQLEEAARNLATWEDRTGDARDGLTAQTIAPHDGVVAMSIAHTVSYGMWLELIQNGRFAVLQRTLEEEAPRIVRNAMQRIYRTRKGFGG